MILSLGVWAIGAVVVAALSLPQQIPTGKNPATI